MSTGYSFLDEFYKRAQTTYENEKELRLREICEERHWDYDPLRIVCVVRNRKAELYYYQTDIGTLEPLVALSPIDISFSESPTDFSMKMKYEQRELHQDIFKPLK